MRIAISGSHSLGKSTVVNDWVAAHPEFRREEEPYRALALNGPYEILFRESSTRLHNGIQLYYNISRVNRYSSVADDVIFDRAPVDYLAYSQYTANRGTTDIDSAFVASMVAAVRESLDHLDVLAFVPKSESWPVEMEADGIRPVEHAYRDKVDMPSSSRSTRWPLDRGARRASTPDVERFAISSQQLGNIASAAVAMNIDGTS